MTTHAPAADDPIVVEGLAKTYQVTDREGGFGAAVKSFVKRKYKDVKAVQNVNFRIGQGEIVGFLGPNGAGKTTTLKMLSGLLHPTGGKAIVLGHTPWNRESGFLSAMTLVMGQRNRLSWDIPAADSFLLNQAIYRISDADYKSVFGELNDLLDLKDIMRKPVRQLSLGERMKCELAAALLHRPQVLFLDEPTIGLDVTMQVRIRDFVAEYNARYGATVILTSHYMADVTALCNRLIVIDKGRLLYDGDFKALIERMAPYKIIKLQLPHPLPAGRLAGFGEVQSSEGLNAVLRIPRARATETAARILSEIEVDDVTFEDPPVEDIIRDVFAGGLIPSEKAP